MNRPELEQAWIVFDTEKQEHIHYERSTAERHLAAEQEKYSRWQEQEDWSAWQAWRKDQERKYGNNC